MRSDGEFGWAHNSGVGTVTSGVRVDDNVWHHVGVTRDGNEFYLWVDGTSHSVGSSAAAVTQSLDWHLGTNVLHSAVNALPGLLDDVRVYNRAFTVAEVTELAGTPGLMAHWKLDEAAVGTVVDAAGNYDTNNPGVTVNQPGARGTSYFFDGIDDKIDINSSTIVPESDPFTIAAWIKTSDHDSGGTGGQGYIFSNWQSDDVGRSGLTVLDGELNWFGTDGGGSSFSSAFSGEFISDDVWHLVGVTRDTANELRLWVDGESLLIDPSFSGPVGGVGANWLIGGRLADELRDFHGNLDDVRVYNRALDAAGFRTLIVPEPSSWLVSLVLVLLCVLRRRRGR